MMRYPISIEILFISFLVMNVTPFFEEELIGKELRLYVPLKSDNVNEGI